MTWPVVKIRDVAKAHYGKALKKEFRDDSGSFDVFGSSGHVGVHTEALITYSTLIIGRKGSVGEVIWAPKGGWVIDTAYYLELLDKDIVDLRYLYYALKKANLAQRTITTSIPGLNRDDFYDSEIPLPPLAEQKRIAAILDKADAIRRKRQQAIKLADDFLRAVFLDMFGDPVTNPKGWEVRSIDELCTEIVDCVNRTAPIVDYPTPYKMIRTTNVRNYALDILNVRFVDEETYKKWIRRLKPKVGDIIFTREAPAGEAAVVHTDENIFLGQRTMHFRPDHERISSEYLMFELMGNGVRRQINRMHAGSTVTHLSVPECKKFQIRVPPLELQKKFELIRKAILRSSALRNEAVEIPLFESISQKAFRGEL